MPGVGARLRSALRRAPRRAAALALAASLAAGEAPALNLVVDLASTGTSPDPAYLVGGGSVAQVFQVAAAWWEASILDDHTVVIEVLWDDLGPDFLGIGLVTEADAQGRTTRGALAIDVDSPYFVDPTPAANEEFPSFSALQLNLGGGGPMNVGRMYRNGTGDAGRGWDLLELVMHEMGHVLGLFNRRETRDGDVDVLAPLPFAGAAIPFEPSAGGHLDLPLALMDAFSDVGDRHLPSAADILAVAQLGGFTSVDLAPALPAPGPLPLLALGLAALAAGRRRR
jgi:hypothetical protein